jgi:hypothetical protein
MVGLGIGPAIVAIATFIVIGSMPELPTFGPTGLTGHDEGGPSGFSSRETVQFVQFWYLISFFLIGIGLWILISGLKSKAIISSREYYRKG